MGDEHFRKLERMYASANSQQHYTTQISIDEGMAEQVLPIREEFFHAAHAAHGSVYFKVVDDTCFFAAQSLVDDVFVLTSQVNLHLLRPVDTGSMHARAQVVHASRNLWVCEARVTNDDGRAVAFGTASFQRSRSPLGPDIGYR